MRVGSSPTRMRASSPTAATWVAAWPSSVDSPHPDTPSSVSTLQKAQRGGTGNASTLVIFMSWLQRQIRSAQRL